MKLEMTKLKKQAFEIRKSILLMLGEAGSGHSAGALGMADIFTSLYFSVLNHKPKHPDWEDRDRVILSAGHICPVLYATLAHSGYFPLSKLKTLRKLGSGLQGHPHNLSLVGIETSSGPLGQGISQAVGFALAGKIDKKDWKVFCISSDGEQDEGQTWEAVMLASKYNLKNLILIIDRNRIQISGNTENVMPLDSLKNKYLAFGWDVLEIDGHSFYEILESLYEAKSSIEKPTVVIAKTIPGKGVNFMEGQYSWHGRVPRGDEIKQALEELEKNYK
ncbi:transketolase [Patescibacteria group bacterium]